MLFGKKTAPMVDSTLIADAAAGGMNSTVALQMAPPIGPVDKLRISRMLTELRKYQNGKTALDNKIIENNRWYKLRHWDAIRRKQKTAEDLEPASAYLFNNLASKHADMMDNFPEPNILPRESGDETDAEELSSIVPVVLERNEFEETYSDSCWYKLKNGCVPYGVFWDKDKENGLGDICVKKLDLLNLFWKPGITDIQQSPYFFVAELVEHEELKAQYPWVPANATTTIKLAEYAHDESIDTSGMSVVMGCYYKAKVDGRTILHYVKFVGETLLYATENDPDYSQRGLYDHGQYPIVFDVLYPEEDMPTGIGLIDVMKEPQIYIDKLDQIILKNALMAGKPRWFVTEAAGINTDEFGDWSKEFVKALNLDERHMKEIKVSTLDSYIIQHRQMKIDEQKETSANRDFSQGGVTGGVTAASAIAALQEAGNKNSRDINKGGYRAYTKIVHLIIECDRQFYDVPRKFRIIGEDGAIKYIEHSNKMLKEQLLTPAYTGEEPKYRVPVFDIKVKPQRSNPFSKMAQNDLAMAMNNAGFFNPQMADSALIALDMMDFEGKQKVMQKVQANGGMLQMIQQFAMIIQQLTGINPLQPEAAQQTKPQEQKKEPEEKE